MFGLDLKGALSQALASPEFKRVLAWVGEKFDRVTDALVALERMEAYEHGLPVKDVPPHDPRRLPFVHRLENVTVERVNIAPALGKPVTRGEVTNIGSTKALITFIQAGTPEQQVDYLLMPSTTFAFSFFFDAIEVADAGEGPVSVQVVAQ